MKHVLKAMLCLAVMIAVQAQVFGQIAYSITDNNRDVTGLQQQYYAFDLSTGAGTLISDLTINGQTVRREYEGLASIGSTLYGVAEFDTELCNSGSDPITGLSADLRVFRTATTYPVANGIADAVGPQIGELCTPSGFTEAAAAYNPVDGWIYSIAADDTLPASAPRSRLYRVSPTTGLSTQIGSGATAAGLIKTAACTGVNTPSLCSAGGDENPYFDGLAITADGRIYATEARFNNSSATTNGGLFRLFATGAQAGRAQFVSNLFSTDVNRDTGLASVGNTLYLLLEDGRVYSIGNLTPQAFGAPPEARATPLVFAGGGNTLTTPGCLRPIAFPGQFCGDLEGFDIPALPIR